MRIVFHPEARTESIEAAIYYDSRSPGAGVGLLDALDSALDLLLENPLAWPPVAHDVRQYILPRYPYAILYRLVQDQVYVVAFKHHARHDDYWKHRLRG